MVNPSDKIAIIAGEREITFNEMLQYVSHFAQLCPQGKDTKTLIFSENCEGWFYALYGVWAAQGVVVPVDASSTMADLAYIMGDCTPQAIWTTHDRESLVAEAIAKAGVSMRILFIDDMQHDVVTDLPMADTRCDMGDIALICYTSGTTGDPKGVMLSFGNITAMANAVWKEVPIFHDEARTLVLLPLHHVLPLVGTAFIPMVVGCGVAISPSLAAADIMGTLQRGKIRIMVGVPRLWQTLYRGIKGKIDASFVTRALYSLCEKVQSRWLSRLIFTSVHKKMGGHLKYCISGGAALDSDTALGLKTLGIAVLEGYGMTETSPIISFTRPDDIRPGCVGLPMPSVEVKLVDGELCARGKNVMQGYYNRPEETAAVIDSEGFVHTGDLATIDEAGRITITGRKKEIIVLSNGKNVNPVEIEEKIEHYDKIIKEAAVTEEHDLLKAIIVPQPEWANGKTDAEMEELLKREVLEPYNQTVVPYKKVMSLMVFHGELPRTRLEKLQRFKLRDILKGAAAPAEEKVSDSAVSEPTTEEFRIIADYIAAEKHVKVRPTDHLETDLAMDSLDKVSLQGFIEQTFGIKFSADQIVAFKNVGQLAEQIAESKTHVDVEGIDWHKLLTRPADNLHIPHMATTGIIFTRLCKWLYRLMFKCEAHGLENIPTDGPVIFAPNHQSFLDAPLVVTHLSSATLRNTYFYAKKDHVRGAFMRMLARNHNVVIMDMRTLKDSIRTLGQVLADGKNLVIFPEGTRTRTGQVGVFKKTFAILAREIGVPVVPVCIEGAYEAWPRTKKLPRRHKVTVTYLPPVSPSAGESYEELAERVREAVVGELSTTGGIKSSKK
ncbi:MAG: AMP-binding protein [Bacteroidales bacterium]|nr:AMP-binding protein [Bacteroidales bacterium]